MGQFKVTILKVNASMCHVHIKHVMIEQLRIKSSSSTRHGKIATTLTPTIAATTNKNNNMRTHPFE